MQVGVNVHHFQIVRIYEEVIRAACTVLARDAGDTAGQGRGFRLITSLARTIFLAHFYLGQIVLDDGSRFLFGKVLSLYLTGIKPLTNTFQSSEKMGI